MLEVNQTFKKRVSDGRGKALKGDLEPLAGGRVYSGRQALEIGLVDEIGGLREAIAHASTLADVENAEVKLLPEPKSGLEGLFARPEKDDDEIIRASVGQQSANPRTAILRAALGESLPHAAKAAVARLARRVEAFQKSPVLLLAPDLELR
jgi:protease-4